MDRKVVLTTFLSVLLFLAILGSVFMVQIPSVMAHDPIGTMALFDAVDNDHNVTWAVGSEPGSYPYFDVKLKLTNISDAYDASFSLEYDPAIINYSSFSWGNAFVAAGKTAYYFMFTVDYANGWIKNGGHGHYNPDVGSVKTYTYPSWGVMGTFTFEFIGSPPPIGSPISTFINITNVAGRTSLWSKLVGGLPDNGPFQTYTSCQFHYGAVHEIAVTNVATSKTVVGQGYFLPINVTVENQGNYNETFNVTAHYSNETLTHAQWDTFWGMGDVNRDGYIDDTDLDIITDNWGWTGPLGENPADISGSLGFPDGAVDFYDLNTCSFNYGSDIWTHFNILGGSIGTQTVNDLSNGSSTIRVFTWNTTGVPYGNYTISAQAPPLPYEPDTDDNTYTDGWVVVTLWGDATADGIVDIFDLTAVALATVTYYEPCDFNGDGVVDIFDLTIVALAT